MAVTPSGTDPMRCHDPDARRLAWRTTAAIASIERADALVALPIGAIEQHGAHLPCVTDALVADEVTRRAVARTPRDVNVWTLPLLPYGRSVEHLGFAGTVALSSETLLAVCRDIGRSLAASGFRKLAFVNGHGGQPQLLDVVARDIRIETGLEVYPVSPHRLGRPAGVEVDPEESAWGLHAGFVETSLLLALAPDAVDLGAAVPDGLGIRGRFGGSALLSLEGAFPMAWVTRDLSTTGAVGDPRKADAAVGEAILDHLAEGVARLFGEICRFSF